LPAAALKDDATIAIDWHPVFFETYLNQKELKAIINDKTTVAHRAISTRSVSIGDCMSIFTAPETLEKDSTPRCPVCKDWHSSGVIKSLDLWSTPPVLMLHFKRLMMNQKLYTMVAAPVTGFDPGPYLAPRDSEFDVDASEAAEIARYEKDVADLEDAKMKPEERASKLEKLHKQADARVKERVEERARLKVLQEKEQATNGERPLYDLYAVVNHHGGARSGHYIAYAKSRRDGLWYSFNDRMVTQVHENAVVTESAYLLMYEQRGFGNKYMSDLRELKKSGVISEHVEKEKQKALQQITKRDCLNGCTWSGCFGFCPGTCCGEDDDEDELSGAEEQDVELELDDNTDAETPGSKTRPHGVRVAPAESIVSEEET
jgi:hypothetical protein